MDKEIDDSIFFHIDKYFSYLIYLYIVIGGRGIGKTFSTLEEMMINHSYPIYIRRTGVEMEACCGEAGNPFKEINKKYGWHYHFERKNEWFHILDENGEIKGYGTSLAQFANLRGVSFEESDFIFFDEFIQEKTKKNTIKEEADAFFNMLETIIRNREFFGRKPPLIVLSSNSVSINSPILQALDLVRVLERMIYQKRNQWTDRERGIRIILPRLEEFEEVKQETFLYRLTRGSDFQKHAINNEFIYDSFCYIERKNLQEYTPVCGYEDIWIYRHKHRTEYYVCHSRADVTHYDHKETEALFIRRFYRYRDLMINGTFYYSDMHAKNRLISLFFK